MKHRAVAGVRFFFPTAPLPCPYVPGRMERRLVTELSGRHAIAFHNVLSQAGFRRSHSAAYVPVCTNCSECVAVRVRADGFVRNRWQNRIWRKNSDLLETTLPPIATDEQFRLFQAYQAARHNDSEMARMDLADYQNLVMDTPVDTVVNTFRDPSGTLVAVCLTDILVDGLSAVYSFFEPQAPSRSLGSYMILWLVEWARALDLPHVYLGFWVRACDKMNYKTRFRPLEIYTPSGWKPYDPADPEARREEPLACF